MFISDLLRWFSGGATQYHPLQHCMRSDFPWIAITIGLDLAVACGYVVIAMHWAKNSKHLPPIPAKRAPANLKNIFIFCGVCGYLFIPIKMVSPAWRLYDFVMAFLVYFTWRYAWGAKDLKVVYNELGRSSALSEELQRTRLDAQRNSFFLNAVSHDLRTPLNGLMLQANLAEAAAMSGDPQTVRSALAEVKASARAAGDLLDGFLEYARLGRDEDHISPVRLEVGGLIREAIQSQQAEAEQKGLYLTAHAPAGLTIQSDRRMVSRIRSNLVSNAVKFTEQGGVKVEAEQTGRAVEIHVTDTGVGIGAEHQDLLFQEFFQVQNNERSRTKGFGLGLSIARRMARQLGGDVLVASASGSGSCFTVVLPMMANGDGRAANESKNEQSAPALMPDAVTSAG